ncbi:unnamed protein product [Zymoseptoria tritici ST99CH_1E4]|uniref:Tc1-like transposase DDE domain-containing protein n=1 Tax=Zymoseptoria tritici ST99CH_1E4 TaxID=1276532 RepID=A0A2H1FXN8_ZYMTR|nr:unnamed protein product [Zymoseptoria tritici ST99CH_1E4]SMR46452.1 unnamed protein product [Zymoseptoria tritici ST99CH_1E4]
MSEIPHDDRVLIVQYRAVHGWTFERIATVVDGVSADAARKLYTRARVRAGSDIARDILQHIDPAPRSGRPKVIVPGSKESTQMRQLLRNKYRRQHQTEAGNHAIQQLRQTRQSDVSTTTCTRRRPLQELDNRQIHNILRSKEHCAADPFDKRPVKPLRGIEKPALSKLDLPDRERHCDVIEGLNPHTTILITCDETPVDFGGSLGHQRILAPQGTTPYVDQHDPRYMRIQWAGACFDTSIERPWACWGPGEDEDSLQLTQKLAASQKILDNKVEEQRARCSIQGSVEHQLLTQKNDEVEQFNASLPAGKKRNKRKPFTPERLFKKERLVRAGKKGGIDFVWYAFEVYQKRLFPYYERVVRNNAFKDVYIYEDNVGLHHKARRLLAPEIEARGIKFLDTPTNSPDLNPIEQLHKDQKKILRPYRMAVTSASKESMKEGEQRMRDVWCNDSEFNALVRRRTAVSYFQGLCNSSRHAEPPFSNRYKDSG